MYKEHILAYTINGKRNNDYVKRFPKRKPLNSDFGLSGFLFSYKECLIIYFI